MAAIHHISHWTLLLIISLFLFPAQLPAENVPHQVGGIALGSRVDEYPDIIQTNFMKEMVITDWHGFRKGVISSGTCLHKDRILKIDMKYEDKSKSFYQQLLKKYRKKFGPPDSWQGDSFGVKYVWKWFFIDENQDRVSLALQFNSKDSNETIGNMVKLSYPGKIEEERLCFVEMCDDSKVKGDKELTKQPKKADWSFLIPQ